MRRAPTWVLLAGSLTLLFVSALVAIGLGPVRIEPGTVYGVLWAHLSGSPGDTDVPFATTQIVLGIRAPRVVLGVLVGLGLAAAGTVLQALLRNPLADPYLVGVSSGATLGVVIVLAVPSVAAAAVTLPVAAFLGGMVAFAGVFAVAQRGGQLPPLRLVLTGVGLAALFTALSQWLILSSPDNGALRSALTWMLGSLTGRELPDLVVPALVTLACIAAFVATARWLDAFALGEEAAQTLGVDVRLVRLILVVLVALTVGVLVAQSGAVGFVALIVPHAIRLLVGTAHRRLLPLAAIWGAIFLIWADVAARLAKPGQEIPLGVVTAVLGAPVFLTILRRTT